MKSVFLAVAAAQIFDQGFIIAVFKENFLHRTTLKLFMYRENNTSLPESLILFFPHYQRKSNLCVVCCPFVWKSAMFVEMCNLLMCVESGVLKKETSLITLALVKKKKFKSIRNYCSR